jgi:hypothetical protein
MRGSMEQGEKGWYKRADFVRDNAGGNAVKSRAA